jgi:transposase-like protein
MATKAKTGFGVSCPYCRHDEDAVVSIDLNDLAECRCSSCDETFSPRQARDLAAAELARWERVLAWVEAAKGLAD